ncbi:MAG: FAD-dependent oxidoreductase, partial [Terriglobia bacterium]
MRPERLVVIGGVAAGMSAASRARRLNPQLEVVVLEKGDHVSYGACGLTYLVSGVVRHPDDLLVLTPEKARAERGLDVRIRHEVVEILPGKKQVIVQHGASSQLAGNIVSGATDAVYFHPSAGAGSMLGNDVLIGG